ncbi:protein phosphatase 2C domain-containing protein [Pseudonocardia sp. ICBG1142]|uniref:protein phosphatase 2C domain-containing protein n=1 Tax=Pseudonocardia sp. ICBG1142 TaxID=2846760 RepID=UPI001CF62B27
MAGPDWAFVLDGATAPAGIDSGCIHDVAWVVRNLAARIASGLTLSADSLPDIVAEAIAGTCRAHADTCDITNPSSPSSTVAVVRMRNGSLDYLSLADSPIVVENASGKVDCFVDDHTARLPSYTPEALRGLRNKPGGFWVASTSPEAAHHAASGSMSLGDVRRIAVLSDGGSRYVGRFGLGTWGDLIEVLDDYGPVELIRRIRESELRETDEDRARKKLRGKVHDDATALLVTGTSST